MGAWRVCWRVRSAWMHAWHGCRRPCVKLLRCLHAGAAALHMALLPSPCYVRLTFAPSTAAAIGRVVDAPQAKAVLVDVCGCSLGSAVVSACGAGCRSGSKEVRKQRLCAFPFLRRGEQLKHLREEKIRAACPFPSVPYMAPLNNFPRRGPDRKVDHNMVALRGASNPIGGTITSPPGGV